MVQRRDPSTLTRARSCTPAGVLLSAFVVLAAWSPPAGAALTFRPAASFPGHDQPISIAIGDLNRDGKPDLVAANRNSADVSVLLGTGSGSFGPATNFGVGDEPYSVAIGDLNGDQKPDLVTANNGSGNVSVLLGTGSGSFGPATNFVAGNSPYSVAIGNLNGGGTPDLVTANTSPDDVSVLLGTGAGAFGPATTFPAHDTPLAVAIGDLNGDHKADLAAANYDSADVSVLLGDGAGSFGAATNFATAAFPYDVAIGDLNRDGKLDLATGSNAALGVSALLGTGTGSFGAATSYAAHVSPTAVAIGDLNGDGKQDLAAGNANSNDASVLLGTGSGSFGPATNFATKGEPYDVAIGDLNRDGAPDLALAQRFPAPGKVSVLLSAPTADVAPLSLRFGSAAKPAAQGTTGAGRRVTIANHGSAPLSISGFALGGASAHDFVALTGTCGAPVAPGSTCRANVSFQPHAGGARAGTLTVLTNAVTNPVVALRGTAGGPARLRLACAAPPRGKLMYVRGSLQCGGKRGKLVRLTHGRHAIACELRQNGMLFRVGRASKCRAPKYPHSKAVRLPAAKTLKLCAGSRHGTLRRVKSYSACNDLEFQVVLKKS